MKVLLLNGSPHKEGCTYTALEEVAAELHREGVETELFWIGREPVAGCQGCGGCRKSGRCVLGGTVNELLDKLEEVDGLVVGSPVYFAGPSGQLCCLMDRLFYAERNRFAGKVGAAVVSCRRGGATAAFDRLNKYFTIRNMVVAGSQYWNQVHGNTPEEVRQDAEGLQTMRTLARNIAWLLRAREGRELPAYEKGIATNFIR